MRAKSYRIGSICIMASAVIGLVHGWIQLEYRREFQAYMARQGADGQAQNELHQLRQQIGVSEEYLQRKIQLHFEQLRTERMRAEAAESAFFMELWLIVAIICGLAVIGNILVWHRLLQANCKESGSETVPGKERQLIGAVSRQDREAVE
jgi:hypothetical protein